MLLRVTYEAQASYERFLASGAAGELDLTGSMTLETVLDHIRALFEAPNGGQDFIGWSKKM